MQLIAWIRRFLETVGPAMRVAVKLHLVFDLDAQPYVDELGHFLAPQVIAGNEGPSTFEPLPRATVHVSISSAAHHNALGLGVPTVILSLPTHYIHPPAFGRAVYAVLDIQREADVLLYLTWNNPAQPGIITGELPQYLGAGRLVLAVGRDIGEPAAIIRRAGVGIMPDTAAQLRAWLEAKRRGETIAAPPSDRIAKFSRETQTRRLACFFGDVLDAR